MWGEEWLLAWSGVRWSWNVLVVHQKDSQGSRWALEPKKPKHVIACNSHPNISFRGRLQLPLGQWLWKGLSSNAQVLSCSSFSRWSDERESLCSAAEPFCSLPLGAEGLSWCLTFLRLWLMKFPWERTRDLRNLPIEASRHSWVILSVRGCLDLPTFGRSKSTKYACEHTPYTFYCGHFSPVPKSKRKPWPSFTPEVRHSQAEQMEGGQPQHSAEQKAVKLITLPCIWCH